MTAPTTETNPLVPWCVRAALALVLVLYALTYHQWIGVYSLGVLLLSTVLPVSIALDRIGQIIVGLVCLVGAYTLAVGIGPVPPHPVSTFFSMLQTLSCSWALLFGCLRLFFRTPWMGHAGTMLIAGVGLFACGGTLGGVNYHLFVLGFVALALWAVYLEDPTRPTLGQSSARRRALLLTALVTTSLVAGSLMVSLPIAYQWANKRLGLMLFARHQSGFDMFFKVGSLRGMIKSRRVALRVKGPYRAAIHLRGVVYNRYRAECWSLPRYSPPKLLSVPKLKDAPTPPYVVEYVSGNTDRYFLPLAIQRVATPDGRVRANRQGIALPLHTEMPDVIGFTPGRRTLLTKMPIRPPGGHERQIPKSMRKTLRRMAEAWTKGIPTQAVAARLEALRKALFQGYRYSLSFERPKSREPILDFLLHNKQGHCEYFASALALLARSIGISTRVAGGYLASEYSTMGGYYIVRDQNAHAWVEAWIPGKGWQTYDATPSEGLGEHMPNKTTTMAAVLDLMRVRAEEFRQWVSQLSYTQLFLSIGLFLGLWIAIRVIRRLRAGEPTEALHTSVFREPVPAFVALLERLSSILPRRDAESLERYAERLQDSAMPRQAKDAAMLVLEYASFRYGQIGEQHTLEQKIEAFLAGQGPVEPGDAAL